MPKKDRSKKADDIIRNHVILSMGAGFIPVLVADVFAVSALQMDMIRQLARVYEVEFLEVRGKAIVSSLTGTALARMTAGRLVKLIPGIGSWIGGMAVSGFAGASTYALGEVFKKHFESGGTILDFDVDRLSKLYKEKFEKGKQVVKDVKEKEKDDEPFFQAENFKFSDESSEKPHQEDVVTRLKTLADLKEKGLLTTKEFNKLKKELLSD